MLIVWNAETKDLEKLFKNIFIEIWEGNEAGDQPIVSMKN